MPADDWLDKSPEYWTPPLRSTVAPVATKSEVPGKSVFVPPAASFRVPSLTIVLLVTKIGELSVSVPPSDFWKAMVPIRVPLTVRLDPVLTKKYSSFEPNASIRPLPMM